MLPIQPFTHDDAMIAATVTDGQARHRVYTLNEVAVVIGRGGKSDVELNAAAIAADGVPVYRRRGGGCSVVLDPGNLIVSMALPLPGVGQITSAFAAMSKVVCGALDACGVSGVTQRGVSDLAVGDRKLGGSCIHRSRGLLYYSTTLLVDPDLELLDRYLPHPPREPDYRSGRSHQDFITTLRTLGIRLAIEDLGTNLNSLLGNRLKGPDVSRLF